MDKDNLTKLNSVLNALKRLGEACPDSTVEKIRCLIDNYKFNITIKKSAALCYPSIAVPSKKIVQTLAEICRNPPIGLDEAIVQMPTILASKCKNNIDYVIACVSSLPELKEALLALYIKYARRDANEEVEFCVSELRQGIEELSQMMTSFSDFIDSRSKARSMEIEKEIIKQKELAPIIL